MNISDEKYFCKTCNYSCLKKYNYNRHLQTKKHLNKCAIKNEETKNFTCILCNKKYKYSQGLSKHKKTCNKDCNTDKIANITNVLFEVCKINNVLQKTILDIYKSKNN
jgi:hypothetical protein